MDLFLLKKIITVLIMPLSIVLILLCCALIFYKAKSSVSFFCLFTATLLLLLSSLPPISDRIMAPIEEIYPAFTHSPVPIDYIIILGCGHTTDYALPETSQLKVCSLQRLVEALRIFRLHPDARLITSGYAAGDEVSNAEKVKRAAMLLGVPEKKILVENYPRDTEEEAQLIAPRVIGKTVVLVTNADHMPRAMKYFQLNGVYPIAAPASPWTRGLSSEKSGFYYLPTPNKLAQTTTAWYETLGRIVQWFKG